MVSPVYGDELAQPLLVDAIDNLPNAVRLVADGVHLAVELVPNVGAVSTLYLLPAHTREVLINRLRDVALICKHPFGPSRTGKILATYAGRDYDIEVHYSVRFYGRDEISTFLALPGDTD